MQCWAPRPHAADAVDFGQRNAAPSLAHPLGTDQLGRDLLARLFEGGRLTLAVGGAAMALSLLLGCAIGLAAGLFPRLDGLLMRLTDLFLSLPLLPFLLVAVMLFRDRLSGAFGHDVGLFLLVVLGIGFTSWMMTARVVRGLTQTLMRRDFIIAARVAGASTGALVTRHILPAYLYVTLRSSRPIDQLLFRTQPVRVVPGRNLAHDRAHLLE